MKWGEEIQNKKANEDLKHRKCTSTKKKLALFKHHKPKRQSLVPLSQSLKIIYCKQISINKYHKYSYLINFIVTILIIMLNQDTSFKSVDLSSVRITLCFIIGQVSIN